jgi:hypothetical protein
VLAQIVKAAGGTRELAAELRVTPNAIWRWRELGIPESRFVELEKLTGVPIEKMRRYSLEKQKARRRGLEWYEPDPERPDKFREEKPDIYAAARAQLMRDLWRYDRRCPPPAADLSLPFKPAPPMAYALFSLSLAYTRPGRSLVMYFARFAHDGGELYYLYPAGTPAPDYLQAARARRRLLCRGTRRSPADHRLAHSGSISKPGRCRQRACICRDAVRCWQGTAPRSDRRRSIARTSPNRNGSFRKVAAYYFPRGLSPCSTK